MLAMTGEVGELAELFQYAAACVPVCVCVSVCLCLCGHYCAAWFVSLLQPPPHRSPLSLRFGAAGGRVTSGVCLAYTVRCDFELDPCLVPPLMTDCMRAGWSDDELMHLGQEMSDVLLYLLRLSGAWLLVCRSLLPGTFPHLLLRCSDRCGIDLPRAALDKMELNAAKCTWVPQVGLSPWSSIMVRCACRPRQASPWTK